MLVEPWVLAMKIVAAGDLMRGLNLLDWVTAGSHGEAGDVMDGSWSFLFGPLTFTVNWICGLIDSGYFAKGMGHEPGQETIPEPHLDEVVIFEEFFTAGLRMPPHPVLADILLKFQIQIHKLTPNAIV
jgi:hypothetical protein